MNQFFPNVLIVGQARACVRIERDHRAFEDDGKQLCLRKTFIVLLIGHRNVVHRAARPGEGIRPQSTKLSD
jgi:hypothetical protein